MLMKNGSGAGRFSSQPCHIDACLDHLPCCCSRCALHEAERTPTRQSRRPRLHEVARDHHVLRLDRALVQGAVLDGVAGPLDQEAHALHLLDVVEGHQADVRLRVADAVGMMKEG